MVSHQKGMTLIEALVTVLILAMGVIALVRFQNYLSYNNNLLQQKGNATVLAVKQLETLKDIHVLNVTAGYSAYASIASGSNVTTVSNTAYTLTWTVNTNTNPDYKVINVAVTWVDQRSATQSITLSSMAAGIDPANSATIM